MIIASVSLKPLAGASISAGKLRARPSSHRAHAKNLEELSETPMTFQGRRCGIEGMLNVNVLVTYWLHSGP